MARFDVYRGLGRADLLVDCQSDLLRELNTRFVVPLLRPATAPQPARRLNPLLAVAGETFVMVTQFAATVALRDLGHPIASLADQDQAILNALDMFISGY